MGKGYKSENAILRQKSEKLLKKKTSQSGSQLSKTETQKLIHELEVHQIELELQYEELNLAKEQAEVASKKYVTQRRQAEEERLKSSEERYQSLFENANIGLYRTTPDGTIVLANKALVKMLGYPSFDELAKRNVEQNGFVTPDQRKAFLEKIEQTGEVENFESTWIRRDRTPVFVSESARAIRDTNGNTLYYDGTVEDITKRKLAEVALIESEEKYRALFETSLDGISLLDLNGKIIFANNQVVNLFGYNQPSEFIGLNGFGLIHPEDRPKMDLYFKEFMTTGVITNCEVRSVKKDGSEFIGEYSATIIKNSNGDPVYMMDVVRDITERRRTEETLRESEARYHLLFEKSADGILIADVETQTFKYANPVLCRMLGYSEEELRTMELTDIHPKQDLQRVFAEFESLARGDKTLASDIPCLRKDGSIVYADINSTNITIDGRPCAVGLFRDITERKEMEEKLRHSEQQFRLVWEKAADGMRLINEQGTVLMVNETYCRFVEKEQSELLGKSFAVIYEQEQQEDFVRKHQERFKSRMVETHYERELILWNGRKVWIEVTSSFLELEEQPSILLSIFRDITKRKRTEEEKEKLAMQIKERVKEIRCLYSVASIIEIPNIEIGEMFTKIVEVIPSGWQYPDITCARITIDKDEYKTPNYKETKWKQVSDVTINGMKDGCVEVFYLEEKAEIDEGPFLEQERSLITAIAERLGEITVRKQTEEALKKSEIQLQVILESTADGILAIDGNGKVIKTNTRFGELWKIPPAILNSGDDATLLNFVLEQLVSPKQFLDKVQQLYNSTDEDSDTLFFKDGRIFERYSAPLILDDKIMGRVWSFRDITERKQADAAIFKSKEQYRLLVESAPDIIFTIANDGTFTSLSPAFETLLSWLPEEWIEKPFAGLIHPDDLPLLVDIFHRAIQGEVPSVFESRVLTKQGHYLFFEFVIKLIRENGEIKGIMGISRHITERKKAEEKINILALAIKYSADCIAITDKDYKIIFVNDSFSKVYGFEKEEIVGQAISVITSRNNLPEVGHSLYSAMAKNEVWTGEVLNKRKDGNDFPVQLSLAPVITDKGELIAIVGVLRDITERRQVEEEIRLKNEQLLKLNAEKDKFFSIIAHDLRGPFNGFLGLTELMAEDLPSFTMDEIQEFSVSMKNSATNLSHLLENLLQWSRMQQGLIPFDPEVIQLLPVVDECMAIMLEPAKNKGIDLTSNIPVDLKVFADNNMLQAVIRNLVSNAVKFTPKGGKVNISAKSTGVKRVEISVKDSGIGMSQTMVDKLFRLDVKTNRQGTEGEPSTGLGLLLCKEFVEKQDGKIWVESTEGVGSTFYFTIPYRMQRLYFETD